MEKFADSFFMDEVSSKVRERCALLDGVLHLSEDLKGNEEMLSLLANLRWRGVREHVFHKPHEFAEKYARFAVRKASGDNEIQKLAIDLIARAYASKASDIHIIDNGKYIRIKFRCLGMLREDSQIELETGQRMIRAIYDHLGESTDSASFSPLERADGRIAKRDFLPSGVHSVRIHSEPIEAVQAENGTGTFMALRLLYDSTAAEGDLQSRMLALGFSQPQYETMHFLTQRTGLVIISGPTGHGKSTVLKHVMESMTEQNPEKAFHSVEDPPEYPLRDVQQIKVSTKQEAERLARAFSYTNAIGGAMRSDPDVMMIGEIRFAEAAVAAIDAALTGHAVWATIHANNAFGIITRIESLLRSANFRDPLDALCDPNVLAGLEYQRLIAMLCPKCKKRFGELEKDEQKQALPKTVMDALKRTLDHEEIYGDSTHEGIYVRGDGCEHCDKQGLRGQTVTAEVISLDQDMLALLRNGKMLDAHNMWKEKGGKSYIEHALELVKKGILDPFIATSRLGVPLNFNKFSDQSQKGGRS